MTYKQFIQELEDDILPSEAECRYLWTGQYNISQLRNVRILRLTKMKNGTSHSFCSIFFTR